MDNRAAPFFLPSSFCQSLKRPLEFSFLKRAIPLLAVTLGVLGVVILLVGAVALWYVERVAVERAQRMATRATERLAKIEGNLQRFEEKVKNVTIDLNKIQDDIASLVKRRLPEALASAELLPLMDQLRGLLDQCEEISVTLQLIANLFEDVADLSAQLDGNENLTEGFDNISATIELAAAALAGIRKQLAEIQLLEQTANPQKLADVVEQTRGPLERLAGVVGTMRQHAEKTDAAFEKAVDKFVFWARTAAALLSLGAAWFVWGQVCLLRWGWAELHGTKTSPAGGWGRTK